MLYILHAFRRKHDIGFTETHFFQGSLPPTPQSEQKGLEKTRYIYFPVPFLCAQMNQAAEKAPSENRSAAMNLHAQLHVLLGYDIAC